VIESEVSRSIRARQLEGIFDVPPSETQRLEWHIDAPIDAEPWSVGLIVGPSGSGKTTIARHHWPREYAHDLEWSAPAVIDDFDDALSIRDIASACQSVGFNTIPAWLRPHAVLSTGEKFRVEVARRLLESAPAETVVIDEFTSVVDRQVAKFGSHSIQKFVRREGRKLVAVSCHYDVIDWLQPDWIIEPHTGKFTRRLLRRRPSLDVEIKCVRHSAWAMFAPFHYLTATLNKAARCYVLLVDGRPASFAAMLYRVHPRARNIFALSRLVTLPDFQGCGLAFVLIDRLAALYRRAGNRFRAYPAHPALVRAFSRSNMWANKKRAGTHSSPRRGASRFRQPVRPCAVFEYVGPACQDAQSVALLGNGAHAGIRTPTKRKARTRR
jgi:ABC-type lipoprotein export system ATPase subunit